ncbi:hypothetical protein [Streptomyces hygroscopicus]|uniref:hypothetical protein n=1 Tax=Streptomyces hygroscopicus TaxID=1912 RepID=UPI0036C8F4BB
MRHCTQVVRILRNSGGTRAAAVCVSLGRPEPGTPIGVSVREVAKARHFADRGVRVRQGSYEAPVALRNSFEGAE